VLERRHAPGGLEHAVEERALGDDHAVPRVREQELHLVGRRRVVDGERDRAEVHRGGVGEVELGPVGQHQGERVALADPERGEPRGQAAHALGVFAPRVLGLAVLGAQRDVGRALGGGVLEGRADGLAVERGGTGGGLAGREFHRATIPQPAPI
jgi:hypothetical protein